ncbi:MAG: hypothetical protein H0U86_15220 [Chloroflexi bacterium]|nr:hypothetical protein [Chloroflexota bacterium]
MSTDRDTTRIVRSWLRTDEHESADRVLDAVLDQLDTTPQRRVTWWPVRRFPEMNTTVKLALAAAAVVVAALLGIRFLVPGSQNVGGPAETPTPSRDAGRFSATDGSGARHLLLGRGNSVPSAIRLHRSGRVDESE